MPLNRAILREGLSNKNRFAYGVIQHFRPASGLMTGAQFLTLMAEALKYRHQPEAQAATVNDFSD